MGLELRSLKAASTPAPIATEKVEERTLSPVPQSHPAASAPTYIPPAPKPRRQHKEYDGKLMEKLVTATGTLITLIGVTLFLVQGTQKGWLNVYSHFGLVVALSLGLIALGHRFFKEGGNFSLTAYDGGAIRNLGGLGFTATGYAALYLDIVAGVTYYHWMEKSVGLVIALVVMTISIIHGVYLNSRAFTLLLAVGSIIMLPILASNPELALLLVLFSAVTLIFNFNKVDPLLEAVCLLPTLVALVAANSPLPRPYGLVLFTAFLLLQAASAVWYSSRRITVGPAVGIFSLSVVVFLGQALTLDKPLSSTLIALVAIFLAGLLFSSKIFRRELLSKVWRGVIYILLTAALLGFGATIFGGTDLGLYSLLLTLATLWVAYNFSSVYTRLTALASSGIALAAVVLSGIERLLDKPSVVAAYYPELRYGDYGTPVVPTVEWQEPLRWLLGVLIAFGVFKVFSRLSTSSRKDLVRGARLLTAAVALYSWVGFLVATTLFVAYSDQGFVAGHMLATLSLIAVVFALLISQDHLHSVWRKFALGLLFFSIAKLFLFDLLALDGFFRVIAFTATGLLMLALNAKGLLGRRPAREVESDELPDSDVGEQDVSKV